MHIGRKLWWSTCKVEDEIHSISKHTVEPEIKPVAGKRPCMLNRPKEEHSSELENVVKME